MGKLSAQEVAELAQRAKAIRRHIVSMVTEAQSGHPGGSLTADGRQCEYEGGGEPHPHRGFQPS